MKYKSWDGYNEIELLRCPFCGTYPDLKYIGNDHTKKKEIEVKCPKCRIKRRDAVLRHGFIWLEELVAKNWNQRPPNPEVGRHITNRST